MRDLPCGDLRIYLDVELRRVECRACGRVKQERLDWLAANPHYTRRFALYVGKQCRGASIKEVAADLHLDWRTVKAMDTLYMEEQLEHVGNPRPGVIGSRSGMRRKRKRHRRQFSMTSSMCCAT